MSTLRMPTKPVTWQHSGALHKVPDNLVLVDLANQLTEEFGSDWYVVIAFSNGAFTRRGETDFGPLPDAEIRERMIDVALLLNKDVAHGGHWVVAWANSPKCLCALWRDADGDMQIPIYLDEPWPRVRKMTAAQFAQSCEEAHVIWLEHMYAVLELKPEETIKLAQGELPSDWKGTLRRRWPTGSAPTAAGWVQ